MSSTVLAPKLPKTDPDLLYPLRHWIDSIRVRNSRLAHWICCLVPCQCPFARTIHLFGKTLQVPPLCHFNPLYNEIVALRCRALTYLDALGIDIQDYVSPC